MLKTVILLEIMQRYRMHIHRMHRVDSPKTSDMENNSFPNGWLDPVEQLQKENGSGREH